jgi:hypothetical protein
MERRGHWRTSLHKIDEYIDFLKSIGCGEAEHDPGRTLLEHLIGTYKLLDERFAPIHVCNAGLFHSVYGTPYFEPKTISLNNRDIIRDIIGEEAENLVFMFCVIPHPRVNNIMSLTDEKLRDELFMIADANREDQLYYARVERLS